MTPADAPAPYGVVAIGRNEGARLKLCLASAQGADAVVYVDSGSTDGSVAWAKGRGIDVVELDTTTGFTAARARNAGFRRLMELRPDLAYIQFVDGDCELAKQWPERAMAFLNEHPQACAAFGRRRERHPEQSIYNRLCDIEWNVPIGQVRAFGGDVMLRAGALEAVDGYRDDLIAGEEPELGVRLRAQGWQISRLDAEMTTHDAAMTRIGQWWRRHFRSGYAFAEGAHLHGAAPERHWVREANRALIWGIVLPIACLLMTIAFYPVGAMVWLVYPLQMLRLFLRERRPLRDRVLLAIFLVVGRFPEGFGYLKFVFGKVTRRRAAVIEYK